MTTNAARWSVALLALAAIGSAGAHHGTAFFFDTSRVITLEGEIQSVEWTYPHRRIRLQSTNADGGFETWTLWGSASFDGPEATELRARLQPGVVIVARAFPSRNSGRQPAAGEPVRPAEPSEIPYPRGAFEAGAGEIRFPDGTVSPFGSGPTF
jgi:hypothetical protein